MANSLQHLASQVAADAFFLGCPLALFAKSEGISEEQLAQWFHCSQDSLVMLRLCRAPEPESATFVQDLGRLATRFSADADRLIEAVRRGQAIFHMCASENSARTLSAARDRNEEELDSTAEDYS